AIIEYLDETHPQPPLLPKEPAARARVRALALAIACDIHPLNNLRVLSYLTKQLGVSEDAKNAWYRNWVILGLQALETRLAGSRDTGKFCHGDTPGLADCCLIPQLFNARRFQCDYSGFPTLVRIEQNCDALPAFRRAAPEQQPDAEAPPR
ncbi:MAG: maleylacetoacetate isomerase, partial [Sulfurifustaceae bacterium]